VSARWGRQLGMPIAARAPPRRGRESHFLVKLNALVDHYNATGQLDAPLSVTCAQAQLIRKLNPAAKLAYRGHRLAIVAT
jgi:hypothetical protein